MVIALLVAACFQRPGISDNDDPVVAGVGCGKQGYRFSGTLEGKIDSIQEAFGRQAGRLHKRLDREAHHTSGSNPRYTLIPTCKNHEYTLGELVNGRFIGVIIVRDDPTHRFSRTRRDDHVAWWVFGAFDTTGAIQLQSQFVSLTAENDALISKRFTWCNKLADWTEETAGWHGPNCMSHAADDMTAATRGDNPWFGCKLGCCYSAMDES